MLGNFRQLLKRCGVRLKNFFSLNYKVVFFSRLFERSFTFNFFRYFFPFVVFFVVPCIFFTISFFFSLKEKRAAFQRQLALSEAYENDLKELGTYAELIIENQGDYEKTLVEIFESLANYRSQNDIIWDKGQEKGEWGENDEVSEDLMEKSKWNSLVEKLRFSRNPNQKKDYAVSLKKMQRVTVRTWATLEHLKDIQSYFNLRDFFKKHIPNGWPLQKMIGKVTSRYGPRYSPFSKKVEFHEGVDIGGVPMKSVVVATADAVVSFAGEKGGFGSVVILRHKYGHETVYAHNSEMLVKVGQKVKKGDPIAYAGSSGRSTGVHLHYEVRLKKKHIDPWVYVVTKF